MQCSNFVERILVLAHSGLYGVEKFTFENEKKEIKPTFQEERKH